MSLHSQNAMNKTHDSFIADKKQLYSNEQHGLREFTSRLHAETDCVKKQLKELYFQPYAQQSFENFINLHHSSLVEMMDNLSNHIDIERTKYKLNPDLGSKADLLLNLMTAYRHLDDLLDFIHTLFGKFISTDEKIPKQTLQNPTKEIEEYKSYIEVKLSEESCKNITNAFLQPFVEFLKGKQNTTWHNLFYCRSVYKEFLVQEQLHPVLGNEDIIWMLYSLNYNTPASYKIITEYIALLEPDNYLECLYHFLRKARQTMLRLNLAFKPDYMSLAEMLQKWLNEEIDFIQKTSQSTLTTSRKSSQPEKQLSEKVLANISVAELACTFKLLVDTRVLEIPNHKDFFRAVASTYRTRNSENISSESLRIKFYKPEPTVQNSVKTQLIRLLNHINKTAN